MKRNLPYHILLALGLLFTAGCETTEEPEVNIYPLQVIATGPGPGGDSWNDSYFVDGEITQIYPEAKVYLYGTEEDYLLRQNPLHEGLTDERGFFYKEFNEPQNFWVYVEKGPLNNRRFTVNNRLIGIGCNNRVHNYIAVDRKVSKQEQQGSSKGEIFSNTLYPVLSRNPAKLNLQVLNNGEPVAGATVTLYLSQEAYEQNRPANMEAEELSTSYGYYYRPEWLNEDCLVNSFVRPANEEGEVYFPNLEPRQYWIKVEKDGKTNAGGMIDTAKPLSEDPNITTSLTVGIN